MGIKKRVEEKIGKGLQRVEENRKKQQPRGRRKISDLSRNFYSKRASIGNLQVIRRHCPFCHHHKALKTEAPESPEVIIKCSRCKKRLPWKSKD